MESNQWRRRAAISSGGATKARGKQRGKTWAAIWAVVMLVCLALGANMAVSTPAWALSADELLDLMVDEGAVTPEKAQKIKEKARKIDKVKKAQEDAKRAQELQQIKQEAKTEAKAEAKAEANKEAQAVVAKNTTDLGLGGISKALKGLNVGLLAYVDYSLGDRPTFMGPLTAAGGGSGVTSTATWV